MKTKYLTKYVYLARWKVVYYWIIFPIALVYVILNISKTLEILF